jgi:hypothetical protein
VSFIQNKNSILIGNQLKGILLVPLLLTFILMIIFGLQKESQAIIKSFKVLPKEFLLDVRITKFIKN